MVPFRTDTYYNLRLCGNRHRVRTLAAFSWRFYQKRRGVLPHVLNARRGWSIVIQPPKRKDRMSKRSLFMLLKKSGSLAPLAILPLLLSCANVVDRLRDSPLGQSMIGGRPSLAELNALADASYASSDGQQNSTPPPPALPAQSTTFTIGNFLSTGQFNEQSSNGPAENLSDRLRTAGIPIVINDGFQLPAPSGQLMPPWHTWEVDAAANAIKNRTAAPMIEATNILSRDLFPSMPSGMLMQLLLQGVRNAAVSNSPSERAWAQLVDSIGGQGSLLSNQNDPAIQITTVQLDLILERVAQEIRNSVPRQHATSASVRPVQTPMRGCYYGSGQWDALPDAAAALQTTGFSLLIDYIKDHAAELSAGAEKLGNALVVANLMTMIGKLGIWATMLDMKVEIDNKDPLERTRSTVYYGQYRKLTATISYNTGNLQALSCLRLALDSVGLDIDIPKNGPIEAGSVTWTLPNGGTSYNGGDIENGIVVWTKKGSSNNRLIDGVLRNYVADSVTDVNGQATVGLEGKVQTTEIPKNTPKILKTYSIQLEVAVQHNSMMKSVANSAGFLNPIVGFVQAIPDLLYSTHWRASRVYTYKLIDWSQSWAWAFGPTRITTSFHAGGDFAASHFSYADHRIDVGYLCPPPADPVALGVSWSGSSQGLYGGFNMLLFGKSYKIYEEGTKGESSNGAAPVAVPDPRTMQQFLSGSIYPDSILRLLPSEPPRLQLSLDWGLGEPTSLHRLDGYYEIEGTWNVTVPLRVVKSCLCDVPIDSKKPCPPFYDRPIETYPTNPPAPPTFTSSQPADPNSEPEHPSIRVWPDL